MLDDKPPEYVRRYVEQLTRVLDTFPGEYRLIEEEHQVYRIWSDTAFWEAFLRRGFSPQRRAEERIQFFDRQR